MTNPRSHACRLRSLKLSLSPATLGVATLGLIAADWGSQLAGDSLFPGGPLDEIAHVFTTLLILWAFGQRICDRFLLPALIASVLIDADHIPARLGTDWLTAGTPRPYTHSLLTVAILLLLAALWRRRRDPLLGLAIGLAIHLWRDTAEPESGVSLLWPWSDRAFTSSHASYLVAMGVFVAIDLVRCRSARLILSVGDGPVDGEV
jgi:MYXO-CTERM domain-containing protein